MKKEYCLRCKKCGEEISCCSDKKMMLKEYEEAAYYHICDKEEKMYKITKDYYCKTDETESELEIEVRDINYLRMLLKHESIAGYSVSILSCDNELIIGMLGKALQHGFNPEVPYIGIMYGSFVRFMGLHSFTFEWSIEFIESLNDFLRENGLILSAKDICIEPSELTDKNQYELIEREPEEEDDDEEAIAF